MKQRTRSILIVALVGIITAAATYAVLIVTNQYLPTGSSGPLTCGGPCPGSEALNMETYQVNTPTNLTMNIRDTGSAAISLVAYYVENSNQRQYSTIAWSGPTIVPNALIPINIIIDGNASTFQSGNSYTIVIMTSTTNQFTFTTTA